MNEQEARRILGEITRLQIQLGGDGKAAEAKWITENGPDAARLASDAHGYWNSPEYRQRKKAKATEQPMLDAKAVAEDVETRIVFTQFVQDLVHEFKYMPNDKILSFIFKWLGHEAPSGSSNFATGRAMMKPQGWVFEPTPDKRGWTARLDPSYQERQRRKKEFDIIEAERAEQAKRLAELEQRAAEAKRKLAEVGGAV